MEKKTNYEFIKYMNLQIITLHSSWLVCVLCHSGLVAQSAGGCLSVGVV